MGLFVTEENRVRCGKCNTEFDLNKNKGSCPLCGFGGKVTDIKYTEADSKEINYLAIPPAKLSLKKGNVILDAETEAVGTWGMFNDFFSGKALLRICANMLNSRDVITLKDLIETSTSVIVKNKLEDLKGFPNNVNSDSAVGRLVYHFVVSFHEMGLFEVTLSCKSDKKNIWNEDWSKILIKPTQQGLEFTKLKNVIFDDNNRENQVLTDEESKWLLGYLKKIDKDGFKEYTWLHAVYDFIKDGHNGNKDLWNWFEKNPKFVKYVKDWSSKLDDPKAFQKQLKNLAQTFASSKISLLRELRLIKNKRNDYAIIGDII